MDLARQVSAQLLRAPESRSNQASTIWAEIGPKWPENGVKGNIWGQLALYNAPYRTKKMQKTGPFPRNRPVRQGKSDAGSNLVATQKLEVPGGPAPQALPGLFGSILVDMGESDDRFGYWIEKRKHALWFTD